MSVLYDNQFIWQENSAINKIQIFFSSSRSTTQTIQRIWVKEKIKWIIGANGNGFFFVLSSQFFFKIVRILYVNKNDFCQKLFHFAFSGEWFWLLDWELSRSWFGEGWWTSLFSIFSSLLHYMMLSCRLTIFCRETSLQYRLLVCIRYNIWESEVINLIFH